MTPADPRGRRRIFVAVPVVPALRDAALAMMHRVLRADSGALRWVERDGLHVTLRFLGEITEPEVDLAVEAARVAATASTAFSITLAGGGAFPSLRRPRTVWVGVAAGAERLAALSQALDTALAERRFRPDARAFHAHVTVARVRSEGTTPDLSGFAERFKRPAAPVVGSQRVGAISVMESTLLPSGAVYREICRAGFGAVPTE